MEHYSKFRREGLRVYSAALQNHTDPYLPVLEDKVPGLSQLSRLSLGVQSIPIERVVGSVSQGRSYAFASNFMPLLESGSEFAAKWDHLYESVIAQGVNQPITCLEYLGEYYVIEGNKRVSVMKAMDARDIDADVTRVYPAPSDDPRHKAYEEYCTFTKESGIYTILFTKPGSYEKLLSLPGIRAGETWQQEEVIALRKVYAYFRIAYNDMMKDKAVMQVGDAFLSYLIAFGYKDVRDEDMETTAAHIRLMANEFEVRDSKVKLVMDPAPQQASGIPLISSLFRPSKIKAAFLFNRDIEASAWNYWHNLGRLEIEEKLGDKVETVARVVPSRTDFEAEIDRLIQEGYTAIFATSPVMLNSCIEPALKHPEVKFLCCSLLSSYNNIRTYYIRFYEAKFLMGLAAGILSRNGKIGYIADFPIYGVASAANAFAIGARMVNPSARIYLNWTSATYFDAENPFKDPEIQVICNRDITAPNHTARDYGLYLRSGDEITNIATLIPQWGPFYQTIVESLLNGTFSPADNKSIATNYWWGIGSRILDVAFSKRFDPYAMRLINHYREGLQDGSFSPFEGEFRDQAGVLRCQAEQRLTPAEILCMDYLADNIVGSFPSEDEMIPTARPLVRLQGMHGELKPEISSFSWIRK
ncbi:MAG: BMP family ABC transporter substrate-binding protein [Clostridia bacterium]|nr:BMP family ABC transporter substrate-binding protein [Clostridia bacterium]